MKMGIIGAGGIARTMAGTIGRMDDVECTAIAASSRRCIQPSTLLLTDAA